jgi:hypothetical protein
MGNFIKYLQPVLPEAKLTLAKAQNGLLFKAFLIQGRPMADQNTNTKEILADHCLQSL